MENKGLMVDLKLSQLHRSFRRSGLIRSHSGKHRTEQNCLNLKYLTHILSHHFVKFLHFLPVSALKSFSLLEAIYRNFHYILSVPKIFKNKNRLPHHPISNLSRSYCSMIKHEVCAASQTRRAYSVDLRNDRQTC
jgi:hypothetical protein